jgi:hypothetical protein
VHGIADVLAFGAITLLAGHISQVLAPTCVLNVSLPQALHAVTAPEKPTSHAHWSLPMAATLFEGHERHALMLVDARVAENLLLGHATHALEPVTGLYVPSGHFSHQSGQILVSTSVPCTCISFIVTWLAIELRTYR